MGDEIELIEQAKTDPMAFGQLYDRFYQPIFGFLLRRTGNVQVAQDLASETFFQALKNIGRYKQRGKPFKSWLFAIAVAQIGNYYRSRKKFLQITTNDCPEIVAVEAFGADYDLLENQKEQEIEEQVLMMKKHMSQLNDKQQNILSLRYESRLTIPEISAVLKMKEGTIKSHIHRATKKLKVMMNESLTQQEEVRYEASPANKTRRSFGTSRV